MSSAKPNDTFAAPLCIGTELQFLHDIESSSSCPINFVCPFALSIANEPLSEQISKLLCTACLIQNQGKSPDTASPYPDFVLDTQCMVLPPSFQNFLRV